MPVPVERIYFKLNLQNLVVSGAFLFFAHTGHFPRILLKDCIDFFKRVFTQRLEIPKSSAISFWERPI